jgi:integrase
MKDNPTTVLHAVIEQAPDLATSSRDKYRRDLDAWIEYAGTNPANWTRRRAQIFYNGLLTKMKPQSANRLMASVAYASRWWAHHENNPDLDFAIVRKASSQGKGQRYALNPDEAIQLLNAALEGALATSLRDRALIITGLETGMRRMSLEGMLFENIKQTPYPRVLVPIKGHGADLFSVPLSDVALGAIGSWRTWLDSQRARKTGPVFRRLRLRLVKNKRIHVVEDTAISGQAIHTIVGSRAKQAGLDTEHSIHPHLFRHSFVTWRGNEGGASDAQIASITGHSMASSGALAGYKDLMMIGESARLQTPSWLGDWWTRNQS